MNIQEKKRQYDELERLQTAEKERNNSSSISKINETIEQLHEWIFMLERLKNGRWQRFGAPEEQMMIMGMIQKDMCERAVELYEAFQAVKQYDDAGNIFEETPNTDRQHQMQEISELMKNL